MKTIALHRRAFLAGLAAAPFALRAQSVGPLVFAASSLQGPLEEALAEYRGAAPVLSYAGSQALARQILAGAPADLFLSANRAWADAVARGLPERPRREVFLCNTLVLATRDGTTSPDLAAALDALPSDARIATGFVASVPAGLYARQSLEWAGLWEAFEPRLVQTENVRVALGLLARGEVAAAFVYRTDLPLVSGVTEAVALPPSAHDPITYAAIMPRPPRHEDTPALMDHLLSDRAAAAFQAAGFRMPRD